MVKAQLQRGFPLSKCRFAIATTTLDMATLEQDRIAAWIALGRDGIAPIQSRATLGGA
jgi:hypothetical protein